MLLETMFMESGKDSPNSKEIVKLGAEVRAA